MKGSLVWHAPTILEKIRAADRSLVRKAQYMDSWAIKNVSELASYFPKLGLSILQNVTHTNTNKTVFSNFDTGWTVIYDKIGDYSTVQNEHGANVALDFKVGNATTQDKLHFNNRPQNKPTL